MQGSFIAHDGALAAWQRDGVLEAGPWGQDAMVRLDGQLARDIVRGLENGNLDSKTGTRLEAIKRLAEPPAKAVLQRLIDGSFARAKAADLVRRDGYHMLWIELTSRCNLRCVHCYASCGPERGERLETDTVRAVLDDAGRLGFRFVQFTGGEPTLHQDLLGLVAHARSCGLEVELFTNAQLLTRSLIGTLLRHDVRFAVSLYGHRPEVHEAVTRTEGSFERTVQGIRWLREAGARMRVAVVLMEQNCAFAAESLAFAQEISAGNARAGAVREMGRGAFDDRSIIAADAVAHHPSAGPRGTYTTGKACVTPDGTVLPCIFTRWLTLGRVGRDGGLCEILARPKLVRAGSASVDKSLACPDCQQAASLLEGLMR